MAAPIGWTQCMCFPKVAKLFNALHRLNPACSYSNLFHHARKSDSIKLCSQDAFLLDISPLNRSCLAGRRLHVLIGNAWRSRVLQPLTDVHRRKQTLHNSDSGGKLVLGIETSCDDTGAAVVDENGRILGESLNSQTRIHVEYVIGLLSIT